MLTTTAHHHYNRSARMTPHLTHPLMYGFNSMRAAAAVQIDTAAGVIAALAVLFASFWSVANAILLIVFAGMMIIDLGTGAGEAFRKGHFNSAILIGGFVGKFMRVAVVMIAALTDLALAAVFPTESGNVVANITPTTKAALVGLIYGEALSALGNVRDSEGELPVIKLVVRQLDRLNLMGRDPPHRRHYDLDAEVELETLREETQKETLTLKPRKDVNG